MASFSRLRPETAALAPHSTTMTTLQSRPVAWHVFLYGINFFKDLLIRTHDNTLVASIWHRFRPQKMSLVALPKKLSWHCPFNSIISTPRGKHCSYFIFHLTLKMLTTNLSHCCNVSIIFASPALTVYMSIVSSNANADLNLRNDPDSAYHTH